MEKILDNIYYNIDNPVCFSNLRSLYLAAKKKNKKIKFSDVIKWSQKQRSYTLHRKRRLKFPRRKTLARFLNYQHQTDLISIQNISKENQGYNYCLTNIDVLSRYAAAVPLKNKTSNEIIRGFKLIFSKYMNFPCKIQSDHGKEYLNRETQKYFKENNIIHFTTESENKASIVERFHRTLKARIYRYITYNNNYSFIDKLQNFVKAYNESYHRSIKMAPCEVTKKNEQEVWQNLYGNIPDLKEPQLKVGDKVRISHEKEVFEKSYFPVWTEEYFIIHKILNTIPKTYILRDLKDEIVKGVFYFHQIIKVNPKNEYWITILKETPKRVLVRFQGWGKKFDEWQNRSTLIKKAT